MTKRNKPELLAPCGSKEALQAALCAGADAVYLGGTQYNARMNARNFTLPDLQKAIEDCHAKGTRVYLTLNTLLYDRELADALRYTAKVYEMGIDAIICADLGYASLVHRHLPDLPLHASTQMGAHNAQAAKLLQTMGFCRMVCAREMSRADITRLCAESPIEIEQFVHGAHCASHSGQCLMSAVTGARSGNRGSCAQPCRQCYNHTYPLSLKDLCLAGHLCEIVESGVASLKIEGRMKHPDYVYGVTALYRKLLEEGRNATEAEIQTLSRLFCRGGSFTDGYYTKKITPAMLGVRTDLDKQATAQTKRTFTPVQSAPRAPILPDRAPCAIDSLPSRNALCRSVQQATPGACRRPTLSAQVSSFAQIPAQHPFAHIFVPLTLYIEASKRECALADGVILPPVLYDGDLDFAKRALQTAKERGADRVLCCHLDHLFLAKEVGLAIHIDLRANVANGQSLAFFVDMGAEEVLVNPELILPQIRDLGKQKSVVLYGRLPLMLTERRLQTQTLTDRRGISFPVRATQTVPSGTRDVVYNSVPTYRLDQKEALQEAHIANGHFLFTTETPKEVVRILQAYQNGTTPKNGTYRR